MEKNNLRIMPSTSKELRMTYGKATLSRLIERIRALAAEPRPQGADNLPGRSSIYRVRQGDYRTIYSVDDESLLVDVFRVGHRRDVHR